MDAEVTQLLRRLANGDSAAQDEIAPYLYAELHKLAVSCLRRERPNHTLQPTDLVNEAYLKLAGNDAVRVEGRTHFFGIAAQIMRRVLTDYARRRHSGKRGGGVPALPLVDNLIVAEDQCDLISDLDDALRRLQAIDPRAARVVELRFFGGLTEEEIAEVVGVGARTVKRDWLKARAWLFGALHS